MGFAELFQLSGLPSRQTVGIGERLHDPSVDRETFQPTEAEKRNASGHLRADAWQRLQFGQQVGGRQGREFFGPVRAGEELLGGAAQIGRAVTQRTCAQNGIIGARNCLPRRQRMETAAQRFAEFRGQSGDHDANLLNTFIGTAKKTDQRLMRILTQNTEPGIGRASGPKHGIGAPRQRLGETGLRAVGIEIMPQGALGMRRALLATPLQPLWTGANGGERATKDADPAAVGGKRPAESLPAIHLLSERTGGNILGEPQGPP